MWKSISLFLGGVVAGIILFLKMKDPDITHVDGDLIESQKVKDNRKIKLSWKERRKLKKEARILKRKQKRLP